MKLTPFHIIIILLSFFVAKTANAQKDSIGVFKTNSNSILDLPSLNKAIEMALNNSILIRNQELVIEQTKIKYQVDKKLILRAVTFNSQYSYGNNSAVINNQLMNVPYTSATATNFYSAGLFLNISAFQITARKKQLQMAELDIEMAEELLKQFQSQIIQEVKTKYVELVKQKNILDLRMEAVSASKLAKDFAERDFKSGIKTMEALSNASEAYTKLSIAMEQSYAAYLASLYEFEILIGKK